MRWTTSIDIDRPVAHLFQAIADQNVRLQWPDWPAATGCTCSIDGDITTLGSVIVFRDDTDVEQGPQRLSCVSPNRVEYPLRNRAPGGREMTPEVDFGIEELSPNRTGVHPDFRNRVPLPPPLRQITELVLDRKARAMHVEDLRLLTAHVEDGPR
ncbi:hypothetical protein [Cryobacterium sp. Y29]|uniref:hypothetical protein n=1 Tax=Cryobacterium sp. Y29 TaxID=2048285 RepID=UPI000CE4767A|nr:hypothetical protein [Cryobacterium sp. Y29]